ncbi:hypothetical protein HMPREF1862_01669 [Varibaculum cambriense]|uniref:Uncharacterized protein n=1 Tax=Varibaculum cambriense TaxID=184870 RepID=A0AB34WXZ9_9ACTO|nr:hypothetical protein HMPREF1862_01669 [Varibaculum cambriense]
MSSNGSHKTLSDLLLGRQSNGPVADLAGSYLRRRRQRDSQIRQDVGTSQGGKRVG